MSIKLLDAADRPSLMELRSFPSKGGTVDIAEQISTKYKDFGICLLNDDSGAILSSIEHSYGPHINDILIQIFTKWLLGSGKRPETWTVFVNCLRVVKLNILADTIEGEYDYPVPVSAQEYSAKPKHTPTSSPPAAEVKATPTSNAKRGEWYSKSSVLGCSLKIIVAICPAVKGYRV